MSVIEGGRFDFDDGGSYVGEWCDGRAHGLGVATGPENQGEYSGEWVMGFESRGVYIWPSGNIYSGGWMKGKRHGEGIQLKGKWVYRGEFTTGFCGRYGVKKSLGSVSRYEGSWHLNLFDGFGIETSSDSSTYAGAWSKGVRQGLGVRQSAPFNKALTQKDPTSVRAATSQSSLLSANDSSTPVGLDGGGYPGSGLGQANGRTQGGIGGSDNHRSGFVLMAHSAGGSGGGGNHTDGSAAVPEKKTSFRKALFRKLRKQKSTGDLRSVRMGGSLRSTVSSHSATSQTTNHSMPDTLQVISREILDPSTTETYWGQWKDDKRSGYGVAERSDGVRYEGEWYNNKKDGYGVTYFPNGGSQEEGRYKENVLVQVLSKRNKLFAIRHSRLKDSVEEAVKNARVAKADARDRAMETANQRAQCARNSADSAEIKAKESQMLSNHARDVTKDFAPDFVQLGVMWLRSRSNIEDRLGGVSSLAAAGHGWLVIDPNAVAKYASGGGGPVTRLSQMANSAPPVPAHSSHPQQQQHYFSQQHSQQQQQSELLEPTLLSPDQECLEVSGGSRRGSFRSSFRRSRDKKPDNFIKPQQQQQQLQQQQQQQLQPANSYLDPQFNNTGGGMYNNVDGGYSIEVPIVGKKTQNTLASSVPTHQKQLQSQQVSQPQLQQPRPPPTQLNVQYAKVNKPVTAHSPQMLPATPTLFYAETSSSLSPSNLSAVISPSSVTSQKQRGGTNDQDHFEHYGAPSASAVAAGRAAEQTARDNEILDSLNAERDHHHMQNQQVRRRSVPSIMTAKPVAPAAIGPGDALLPSDVEDSSRSTEFLNSTSSVYIIENGIRKRVQAERAKRRQSPPLSPKSRRSVGRNVARPINIEPEADELAPLPHNYRIESQVRLRGNSGGSGSCGNGSKMMEGSMPDVSMCNQIKRHAETQGQLLMSREEASQLSQQRRQELLHEQERLRRGEIVIRMADVKDWLKQNYALVTVLLINVVIALVFLHILKV